MRRTGVASLQSPVRGPCRSFENVGSLTMPGPHIPRVDDRQDGSECANCGKPIYWMVSQNAPPHWRTVEDNSQTCIEWSATTQR